MAFMEDFQHLKIELEAIKSATNNFSDQKFIGGGGFGKVYKGEVSHSKGRSMAAFKCLDRKHGQGEAEFLKEISTLFHYKHENLISLLGFCEDDGERILVYEYASKGSLDRHLDSRVLDWRQRVKICLEAAKALEYLHDPKGTHQRVLHCDIKSANILLDDKWTAKLSDLGLSKRGPANQQDTFLISSAVGTLGYMDPLYLEKGFLSKESDVYSFGVLLFEVLYGRLCFEVIEGRFQSLVPTWKQNYEGKKTVGLHILQDMDPRSLDIFSDIAYQCLKKSREDRPRMADVVKKLDRALKVQEYSEAKIQLDDYEEMVMEAEPPVNYGSKAELMIRLSKEGVLLNNGKTWFSLNTKGEHCEMISIADCLIPNESDSSRYSTKKGSRFPVGCYEQKNRRFTARVRTQFLSPLVTYTVNLVFKDYGRKHQLTDLRYKLEGETGTSSPYLASVREDGFHMVELYHITSDCRSVHLEIVFYTSKNSTIQLEGIEFRPLEKMEYQLLEDEKVERQPISDSDADWEEKLPNDYQDIIKWSSKDIVEWRTKKELYSTLSKGFLINDGQEWFSLDKNGKKCVMLSARMILGKEGTSSTSWFLLELRFGQVVIIRSYDFKISGKVKAEVVSPETTYASYLVYTLPEAPEDLSSCVGPTKVMEKLLDPDPDMELDSKDEWKEDDYWYIYFLHPQIPVIRRNVDDDKIIRNPVMNRLNLKGVAIPQQRSDGWMEVQIWQFHTGTTTKMIPMHLRLTRYGVPAIKGLVIQGIEFRPI